MSRKITIDIDVDDIDDDILIEAIKDRGLDKTFEHTQLLTEIWQARRLGKNYENLLDRLIYIDLGETI
jgi:hypothetical protein